MGLKELVINFSLIGMFVFAFLFFSVGILSDNNSPNTAEFTSDVARLQNNISASDFQSYKAVANASGQVYSSEDIATDDQSQIPQKGLKTVGINVLDIPTLFYHSTVEFALVNIFGIGADDNSGNGFQAIFIMIGALITAIIIFYGYKWIRIGDPD